MHSNLPHIFVLMSLRNIFIKKKSPRVCALNFYTVNIEKSPLTHISYHNITKFTVKENLVFLR